MPTDTLRTIIARGVPGFSITYHRNFQGWTIVASISQDMDIEERVNVPILENCGRSPTPEELSTSLHGATIKAIGELGNTVRRLGESRPPLTN